MYCRRRGNVRIFFVSLTVFLLQHKYRRTSQDPEEEESSPQPESAPPKASPEVKIFVAEPMRDKPVTDISGIGDILGRKLALSGFDKVSS